MSWFSLCPRLFPGFPLHPEGYNPVTEQSPDADVPTWLGQEDTVPPGVTGLVLENV